MGFTDMKEIIEFYEELVTNSLFLDAIDVWNKNKINNNNILLVDSKQISE